MSMRRALVALLTLACVACEGRPRHTTDRGEAVADSELLGPRVVELDLRGGIREQGSSSLFSARGDDFASSC